MSVLRQVREPVLGLLGIIAALGIPASATVNFYDDNGAPMNIGAGGKQQIQVTLSVPALGVAQFQTDGVNALRSGWAKVQADQNLSGIAVFSLFNGSGSFVSEVGSPASVPLRSMSLFVQAASDTFTGIALANPGNSAADVTLILRDASANEITRRLLTIPSMAHLAKYAGEISFQLPPIGLVSHAGVW